MRFASRILALVPSEPVGFLEESPNAKSMTRLVAAKWTWAGVIVALASAFAIVGGGVAVMKGRPVPDGLQMLVLASAGVIAACGANAYGALKERTKTSADLGPPV